MIRYVNSKDRKRSGFTLIELLVVISIIAILSVIGLITYSTFLKNSRDARRQSDLKFIQSSLEEYHADQIYYPQLNSSATCIGGQFKVGCSLTNASATKTYMTTLPNDPISTRPMYAYQTYPNGCDNSATMCTSYCLYASSENLGNKTDSITNCPVPSTISGSIYNYAVTRP